MVINADDWENRVSLEVLLPELLLGEAPQILQALEVQLQQTGVLERLEFV